MEMEVEKLTNDVHEIKNNLTKFGLRLELVFNALVGNEITKDGGLVADIIEHRVDLQNLKNQVNNDFDILQKQISELEKKEERKVTYVNVIYAALAAIITIVFEHFLK